VRNAGARFLLVLARTNECVCESESKFKEKKYQNLKDGAAGILQVTLRRTTAVVWDFATHHKNTHALGDIALDREKPRGNHNWHGRRIYRASRVRRFLAKFPLRYGDEVIRPRDNVLTPELKRDGR